MGTSIDPDVPAAGAGEPVAPAGLRFGPDGLIPAVVRDVGGDVLMVAYMDRTALDRTLASGSTVFFSRSRGEYWAKGATSGHVQRVVAIDVDCDADALLVTVEQTGVACHTGAWTCFHRPLAGGPAGPSDPSDPAGVGA